MTLTRVINEIIARGKAEAETIHRQSVEEKQRIMQDAKEKVEEYRTEKERETRNLIVRMRTQEISSAELEAKRMHLSMEKEILEMVYEEAKKKIASLPKEKDEALLEELLRAHGSPNSGVYCAKKNENFVRSLGVQFAGAIVCIGGVVIESGDCTTRMDLTYDTFLKEVYEKNMKDIAQSLFGRK